jgi:alpha-galactosidase
MVDDYGADYIKLDYNADLGVGTELDCDSFGDGLEQSAVAYLKWIDAIRKKHPDVLFETCASGGNRMDYQTLSHFSIVSTSDQTRYKWYPYIAGNILSAVLPEQAAVWSYPVDSYGEPNVEFTPNFQWV